ncbi:MAG: LodA/GoxA family CTQ-dependent oxidase [Calothrix sp. MO_167.B12]|nr:LodA/GoxA family CTQ-dependent oxidase [Calothrix sp. MO_167.B12]
MTNTYTFKIYPSIGISRVGNSDEYYLAPEEAGGLPIKLDQSDFQPNDFRAGDKKLRRQGARFRIYYDNLGNQQEVILGANIGGSLVTAIEWTVRLANKKASWYQFQTCNGEEGYASNHPLRNSSITDPTERYQLIIDPGSRTVTATTENPEQSASFDRTPVNGYTPTFPPTDLTPAGNDIDTLGEIYTDEQGRLIVVGGFGHSGSKESNPVITEYANNDNWWDDISDGSVTAQVTLGTNDPEEAEPAWVIVAPPAYAPQILNLVSLYDTIFDVAVRQMGYRPDIYENSFWNQDYQPDFQQEIQPILERGSVFPWVTAIPPKAHKFDFNLLGNPEPEYNGLRQYVFTQIRPPNQQNDLKSSTTGYPMMPYLAGDDATGSSQKSAQFLTLTQTQYFLLQQWANGNFTNGASAEPEQPGDQLTRATLENCVGGAFSPGIEITWICRNPQIYTQAFRIKHKPLGANDPLSLDMNLEEGLEPGDLSKYMALPWQADFNECSSQPLQNRYVWWWPAQRPEFVYLPPPQPEMLKAVPDESIKDQQVPWIGIDYDQTAPNYIMFPDDVDMVEKWDKLGFIIDISEFDEYQQALAQKNWTESYYAEVDRILPRDE